MSALSGKLAAAREARPTRDVRVVLDGELAREIDRLNDELETAKALAGEEDGRLGVKTRAQEIEARMESVRAAAQDSVVTLRFTRLPGRDWAVLTSRFPPRGDVPIDKHYGYDYDAVCEAAAAASGVMVVDGEAVPLTVDADTNEWAELFEVLTGRDVQEIRDAQWNLNEYEPQERLNLLVKGFGAAPRSDNK